MILSAILHFADGGAARDIAATFGRAIVPGSYLIISVGSGNRAEGENFTSANTAARVHIHAQEEILVFFDGLELVPPGAVPAPLERRRPGPGPRGAHRDLHRRGRPQAMKGRAAALT